MCCPTQHLFVDEIQVSFECGGVQLDNRCEVPIQICIQGTRQGYVWNEIKGPP